MIKKALLTGLAALVLSSAASISAAPSKEETSKIYKRTSMDYSFLDIYNSQIEDALRYFQNNGITNLPPKNLVKAMIFTESGSANGKNCAFAYDPMQIANKNDPALKALQTKSENTYVLGDFSFLKGKKTTPHKGGRWDYSQSNMDPQSSIYGGLGWLIHKSSIYGYKVTEPSIKQHTVVKGDTYESISHNEGTSIEILKRLNPSKIPNQLRIGDKLNYQTAIKCVIGNRSWEKAVALYNGGGDKDYVQKVYEVKAVLDKRDAVVK